LLNAYNSKIMNETNVVVTRLTSVTIMMGLWTVVGGIYGMNLEIMGQNWGGYLWVVLGSLVALTIILFFWFRKKKWI
jgi:magnesium transporter